MVSVGRLSRPFFCCGRRPTRQGQSSEGHRVQTPKGKERGTARGAGCVVRCGLRAAGRAASGARRRPGVHALSSPLSGGCGQGFSGMRRGRRTARNGARHASPSMQNVGLVPRRAAPHGLFAAVCRVGAAAFFARVCGPSWPCARQFCAPPVARGPPAPTQAPRQRRPPAGRCGHPCGGGVPLALSGGRPCFSRGTFRGAPSRPGQGRGPPELPSGGPCLCRCRVPLAAAPLRGLPSLLPPGGKAAQAPPIYAPPPGVGIARLRALCGGLPPPTPPAWGLHTVWKTNAYRGVCYSMFLNFCGDLTRGLLCATVIIQET